MNGKRLYGITVLIISLLVSVFFCAQAFAVDLQISQLVDNPDPAIRGGQITYSITVENNANDTATGVQLSVPLPATTSFVTVSDPRCSHDGGTPGTVTCTLGDLVGTLVPPPTGPGPVITIDVVIQTTASTPATINIGATITPDTNPPDTNPANNFLTQNTTIDDGADLVVAKSDAPDPVIAGGNITYTIDVTNNGPNDAYTITVEDTLSVNMTYVSAGGSGWSCSHNGVNPGGVVTCQRGTIANGTTAPAITLVAQETGAITGTITNSVTVSAVTGDPDINNNTITEDTTVNEGADLSISKIAPTFVIGNDTAVFTLRPRNNGPFDAQTVEVTDTIPAGFTGISANGPGWTCSVVGQDVTCTRATYAVGATDDIQVQTTAPASGAGITNTAVITAVTPDPDLSNNSDSVTFDIVPDGADLSISKTKSPDPVAQGSDITSTFVVTNNGPRDTSGTLTLVETLPAGETYQSYSGTNWSCSYDAGPPETLTCTYSATPLAVGASTTTLTIITTATGTGPLTNIGTVSDVGGQPDGVPGNNDDSETVVSTAERADLTVDKNATTANGNTTLEVTENTITYTIDVINNGPDPVTGVVLTDTVPGYVSGGTVVTVTNSPGNYTCTPGSTVTCTQQSGSLASGATDQFEIQVTRPLYDGVRINTATVNSTDVGDPNRTNNSDTATVTIDPICDVEMQSKTVTPNPVPAGTESTYVMTFRNNGPSTAQNVVVTDVFSIPGGGNFTFISANPSEGSCSWTDPTLTCTGMTLNNGETQTVTVVIRPNWQGGVPEPVWTIDNTATITTTTTESNAGNNTQTATLNVESSNLDLLVNKTDLVDPIGYDPGIPANNIITYEVVINNRGPSLATSVVLTDDMTPKNGKTLTFRGDWADAGGTIGPNLCNNVGNSVTGPATQNITCNFPDLAPNTTYTRYLLFEVITAPDSTGDTHHNIATVNSNEVDRNLNNNAEEENTSVRQRVDLVAAKAPSLDPVQLRQPFNWIITVTNSGPGQSIYTNVTDTLPADMEFYGAAPSWIKSVTAPLTGTCSTAGRDLSCDLGWFEPGEVATITVPVRVTSYPGGGTTTNCCTATTSEFDPDPSNNTNQCSTVTVQRSSIEGYVYRDLNDNGAMEGGETGISGVRLDLTGTDAYGNAVNRTVFTNASGFYIFANLSPSDASGYTITETQPPIYYFDGLESDDNGATAIPGSRTTDFISGIDVPPNTALAGYLFGEIPAASISGYVWNDEDNDGVRDAGETTGIPNVQLTLTGTDDLGNPVNATTTTDAAGAYSFGPLRPSNPTGYTVTETQPPAWADGLDSVGSVGGTLGNDVISNIVLAVTTTATDYNFGEIGGSIAGTVYHDINNNGIDEAAEPGIPNVTVTLTGTDFNGNAVNRVTTTAADGSYLFSNLPMPNAAGYTITETQPGGWNDGQDTVGSLGGTLGNDVLSDIVFPIPGAAGTGYNFGELLGAAGVGQVSGTVWLDLNHDRVNNDGSPQVGWVVELIQRASPTDPNYTLIASTTTDALGQYSLVGLPAPSTYEIRFLHPSGGYIYGHPISVWPGVDLTYGTIRNLTLAAGDNATNQDLPLDPSGVIYDAVTRLPVAGATITISGPPGFNPVVHLVGGAANVSQTTDATGLYQFLLLNTAPVGTYTLMVTAYPTGYVPSNSVLIPPCSNTLTVLAAPAPAIVQNNAGPPSTSTPGVCPATSAGLAAGADTTQYFLSFDFDPATSANVVNNHIPLDPAGEAFLITKTVNKKSATVGDLILYTLRIQNTTAADFVGTITIRDNIPPGFKYVEGSARIDGQPIAPVGNRPIEFQGLTFLANQTRIITYILVVGSGVQEGEYENTAFAMRGGNRISNIALARVCVIKDPIFDLTTIIGKVFHDKNENGVQDEGEDGIALAKVVSVRGEIVTTDKFGRYHIAGVDPGRYDRGSNYILKVDPTSLPQGARVTTENPRVIRITSALMQKINFGIQLPAEVPGSGEVPDPMGVGKEEQVVPGGARPSISVSQDRFLTSPKLNLSIGNDDALMITESGLEGDIAFFIYTNYPDCIQEYKISIYDKADFECKYPLKTIVLKSANNYGPVYWDGILDNGELIEPNKTYKYILEVYNEEDRRDETLPKFFTVSHGVLLPREKEDEKVVAEGELPGFGIDNTAHRSIIPEGGKVIMYGKDLAPSDQVYIDGESVAVAEDGTFVAESIKASGEHEVEIAVKDAEGVLKNVQVKKIDVGGEPKGSLKAFFKDFFKDFFVVGIVDLTLGQYSFKGHIEPVSQDDHYDEEIYVDGRAAFYLKGKIKGKYLLTAYLDTEEGELQDIYKRLGEKDPRRIFRNLDPDKYYPVYGDDSTLISDVETQGKFYVKLEWDKSMAL